MKKNHKSIGKPLLVLLFFLAFSIAIVSMWQLTGYLVIGHDTGYKLNIQDFFHNLFFIWSDSLNFGEKKYFNPGAIPIHLPELLFTLFTNDIFLGQQLTFIYWQFLLFLPLLLVYILFYRRTEDKKMLPFFVIGSFLYAINLFNLQGWGVFWRTRFSIEILLPILFFFLYKTLDEKRINLNHLFIVLLLSIIFNGGGSLPLFGPIIVMWLVIGIYFFIFEKNKKEVAILYTKITLFYGLGFILLSFYWIYPTLKHYFSTFTHEIALVGGIEGVTTWLKVVSKNTSYLNLFRLQGIPSWDNTSNSYAPMYLTNKVLIVLSYIWPILVFSSFFFTRSLKEKKLIALIALLGLVGVFFSAGLHSPLGWAFALLIEHVPGFAMYRTAFYKFAPLVWFSFTVMASFTLYKIGLVLDEKIRTRFTYLIYIIFIGVFVIGYHFPLFNSNFFHWDNYFSTKVKPPDYIFQFQKWTEENDIAGRILLIPQLEHVYYADSYTWGYWSIDPLPNILSQKSMLIGNRGDHLSVSLISQLYKAILLRDQETVEKLSRLLDVEYFLVRGDVYYNDPQAVTTSPISYIDAIEEIKKIEKVKDFGKWSVYRMRSYKPTRAYIASGVGVVVGEKSSFDTEVDLLDEDELLIAESLASDSPKFGDYSKIFILPEKITYNLEANIFDATHVRLYPDSVFYPLIQYKNDYSRKNITDPNQKIDFSLGFLVKKIKELEYLEKEKKEEHIETQVSIVLQELDYLQKSSVSLEKFSKENYEQKIKASYYLTEFIDKMNDLNQIYLNTNILIIDKLKDVRKKLGEDIRDCIDGCALYGIRVPARGEYSLMVSEESLLYIQSMELDRSAVATSSSKNNVGRLKLIDTIMLPEGNHLLKITFKEQRLAEDTILESDNPYTITINQKLKSYMIKFDYSITEDDQYILKKNFRNAISGTSRSEAISLKGKGVYKDKIRLSEGDELEKIEFSWLQRSNDRRPHALEIRNANIINQEDADLVFYGALSETEKRASGAHYETINPSQWDISITAGGRGPKILAFSNLYDDGWSIKGKDYPHLKVNGNLNAWILPSSQSQSYETIYFSPQDDLALGLSISGISLIGIFIFVAKNKFLN